MKHSFPQQDESTAEFADRYLEHEWMRVRHAIERTAPVAGKRVLEVGSNIGATATVAHRLGAARVVGVDVDAPAVTIARANAERWGGGPEFIYVQDSRQLPFPDQSFDVVICNSVLEYVPREIRPGLLTEISRLLAPGGVVVVHGTSNRLWPREVHSGRWLSHWLPSAIAGGSDRGVNPFSVRRHFAAYTDLLVEDRSAFHYIKSAQGMSAVWIRALDLASRALGISAGMLLPAFIMVLRKPS